MGQWSQNATDFSQQGSNNDFDENNLLQQSSFVPATESQQFQHSEPQHLPIDSFQLFNQPQVMKFVYSCLEQNKLLLLMLLLQNQQQPMLATVSLPEQSALKHTISCMEEPMHPNNMSLNLDFSNGSMVQPNLVDKLEMKEDTLDVEDKRPSSFLLFQIPDEPNPPISMSDSTASALTLPQNINTCAPSLNEQLQLNPWTNSLATTSKTTLTCLPGNPVLHPNVIVQSQNSLKRSHQSQQVQVATQTLQEETPFRTDHNFLDISAVQVNNKNLIENLRTSDDKNILRQVSENNAEDMLQSVPPQQIPTDSIVDVDSETDSNHDTALTVACAGGHEELVALLLSRGANIEHRDKKGEIFHIYCI